VFFGICEEKKYQKKAEKYPECDSKYQWWYPVHLAERYEHEEETPSEWTWCESRDNSEERDFSIRELLSTLIELPTKCSIYQKKSEKEKYDCTSLLYPGEEEIRIEYMEKELEQEIEEEYIENMCQWENQDKTKSWEKWW
jgi:hypothetical protein